MNKPVLPEYGEWLNVIQPEIKKKYFTTAMRKLATEQKKHIIYPPEQLIFNAFIQTPFEKVKVIILGQDPYHGPSQAHGLSFSVPEGVAVPRSLKNIFKELAADLKIPVPETGNLEKWTYQGVLLLNTCLTVRAGEPKSHQNIGWEKFTDYIISTLSDRLSHRVFILWGNDAQQKIPLINPTKHLILTAAHPSPFSASRGFFGCRHFSKANAYLLKHKIEPIDWKI